MKEACKEATWGCSLSMKGDTGMPLFLSSSPCVVWCGVVWLVRCGVVWLIWCGVVGVVWRGVVGCNWCGVV